jgi:hypothetical protein
LAARDAAIGGGSMASRIKGRPASEVGFDPGAEFRRRPRDRLHQLRGELVAAAGCRDDLRDPWRAIFVTMASEVPAGAMTPFQASASTMRLSRSVGIAGSSAEPAGETLGGLQKTR